DILPGPCIDKRGAKIAETMLPLTFLPEGSQHHSIGLRVKDPSGTDTLPRRDRNDVGVKNVRLRFDSANEGQTVYPLFNVYWSGSIAGAISLARRRACRYLLMCRRGISLCMAHTIPNTGAAALLHPGTGHSCFGLSRKRPADALPAVGDRTDRVR